MVTPATPLTLDAKHYKTRFKVWVGGALPQIADARLGQGANSALTANTVTTYDWYASVGHETTLYLPVTSNTAFLNTGTIVMEGPLGLNWYTYEKHPSDPTLLINMKRTSGLDKYLPAGTVVSQWREITSLVRNGNYGFDFSGNSVTWSMQLTGHSWNSRILNTDHSILLQISYWNDLYYQWTPYIDRFLGYIEDVRPVRGINIRANQAAWTCSARGRNKYLRLMEITPGPRGPSEIFGTWAAKSTLSDPNLEPDEGFRSPDMSAPMVGDDSKFTVYCSSGAPQTEELPERPSGNVRTMANLYDDGPKINQVYPGGWNTGRQSQQKQWFVEIVNNHVPNDAVPSENVENYHTFIIENSRGQRGYLWSKNGSTGIEGYFNPGTSLVICSDEAIFRERFSPGPETTVVEVKQADGWYVGADADRPNRGAGSMFYLNPKGDWFAIRAGRPGTTSGTGIEKDQGGVGFCERWIDFVAWGDPSLYVNPNTPGNSHGNSAGAVPVYFWGINSTSSGPYDQNALGPQGRKVWCTSSNTTPGVPVLFPGGIRIGSSIRRKNAVGGGVFNTDSDGMGTDATINLDGNSDSDWELLNVPVIGYATGPDAPGSLPFVEDLIFTATQYAKATVDSDFISTTDPDKNMQRIIKVNAGGAQPYPPYTLPGECIIIDQARSLGGGSLGAHIRATYTHRDASRFYGVTLLDGLTDTLSAGAEITYYCNTSPPHMPPRFEPCNLPMLSGIRWKRWKGGVQITILVDNYFVDGTVDLEPGDGYKCPSSGTVHINGRSFTYSGKSGDTLTGVNKGGGRSYTGTLYPGNVGTIGSEPSVPKNYMIRVTARTDPNDVLTYIGDTQSVDWTNVHYDTNNASVSKFIPAGGPSVRQYVSQLAFLCWEMSDQGRFKMNEISLYHSPMRDEDPEVSDTGSYNRVYRSADLLRSIFTEAGVPPYLLECNGGPPLSNINLSLGSVWDTAESMASKTNDIIYETGMGRIGSHPDPRMAGSYYQIRAPFTFGVSNILGDFAPEEHAKHQFRQVKLIATNAAQDEVYTVFEPPNSLNLGEVRTIADRYAQSEAEAKMQARFEWRKSTGGFIAEFAIPPMDDIVPLSITRIDVDYDTAGIEINRDAVITKWRGTFDSNKMTAIVGVEEYVAL